MLISHGRKKFIFVHIYKNAGTSLRTALAPHLQDSWQLAARRWLLKIGVSVFDPCPLHNHVTARQIVDHLGQTEFKSYFSFAIARNPWDWQVSLYRYMLKSKDHPQHKLVSAFTDFDAYIRWRCREEVHLQTDFILDSSDRCLVDYVGRFEAMDELLRIIRSRLNIEVTLPKLNVSRVDSYKDYYNGATRQLVEEVFEKDINYFGYKY